MNTNTNAAENTSTYGLLALQPSDANPSNNPRPHPADASHNSPPLSTHTNTLQHTETLSDTLFFGQHPALPFKLRSDCALARLTPSQLEDLFNWIAAQPYEDVLKRLDEQFGIKTHQTTLVRFFHLYARRLNANQLTDLLKTPGDPASPQLADAAQTALLHRLFEVSHTPQAAPRINELSRALGRYHNHQARQQQLQIARDRLALQIRAFEYNAVREVMKHLVELIRIHNLPDLDDQDKILQAQQLIFPKSETSQ